MSARLRGFGAVKGIEDEKADFCKNLPFFGATYPNRETSYRWLLFGK
jgi:hypothetical protein